MSRASYCVSVVKGGGNGRWASALQYWVGVKYIYDSACRNGCACWWVGMYMYDSGWWVGVTYM